MYVSARKKYYRRAPSQYARAPAKPRRAPPKKPYSRAPPAPKPDNRGYIERLGSAIVPKGAFTAIGGIGGGLVGNASGGLLGGMAGAKVGSLVGKRIADAVGFGDYTIESNTLMADPPQMVNSPDRGGIIVRHREYLNDINASTSFTLNNFLLNPGLPASFPWLSNIAAAYEEYEFRGIIFEFKSLSSDSILSASTSSALGFVAMSTQYNPASTDFVDKHELENYEFANSRKPSESFFHPVECKRRLNFDTHLFVRTSSVPSGQDQKTYDLGKFSIATGGCQAATGVLGELWVSYEVEFFHPKFKYNIETLTDHFARTLFVAATPLGVASTTVLPTGSNLGCTITGTSITFPSYVTGGQYLVSLTWSGTTAASITYPVVAYNNCIQQQYWLGNTAVQALAPGPGITCNTMCLQVVINPIPGASGPPQLVFGTAASFPTGATTNLDIWITEVSGTIVH